MLEETIPLFEPDLGLLFGKNDVNGGDTSHSPLSESWSTVPPQDTQLPAEDERITCSNLIFVCTDISVARTILFLCSNRE